MKNPFKNSELTTILVVSDLSKSRSFYIEQLGADLFREYGGSSVVLKFLGSWILLVLPGGPTDDKPEIQFRNPEEWNLLLPLLIGVLKLDAFSRIRMATSLK